MSSRSATCSRCEQVFLWLSLSSAYPVVGYRLGNTKRKCPRNGRTTGEEMFGFSDEERYSELYQIACGCIYCPPRADGEHWLKGCACPT